MTEPPRLSFTTSTTNWSPRGARDYNAAFLVGERYAQELVKRLGEEGDRVSPNLLWAIARDQRPHWPVEGNLPQQGYIAGFWHGIQQSLTNTTP